MALNTCAPAAVMITCFTLPSAAPGGLAGRINATRLFSVLYGATLNVGRVMSPTLALLVQREAQIQNFKSRTFYIPEITCGGFTASGERQEEQEKPGQSAFPVTGRQQRSFPWRSRSKRYSLPAFMT